MADLRGDVDDVVPCQDAECRVGAAQSVQWHRSDRLDPKPFEFEVRLLDGLHQQRLADVLP